MRRNYTKMMLKGLGVLTLTVVMGSCSVDEYISNKDEIIKQLGDFGFETTQQVMLDVDYGQLSSRALVEVYGEDPLANATAENQTPKGEVIFSAFLDENGKFCGPMDIPAHVKHLYVYSHSMSAPQLMDAELKGNIIKFRCDYNNVVSRSVASRAVSDDLLMVRKLNSSENGGSANNFYTIVGGWDEYGNVEDPNGIIDTGNLTGDDVLSIEHYFWMGATSKPGSVSAERAARLNAMKVDNVNMIVQEQYEEDGITYDVESAEVWFTFLTEYAWNENTVGYYFFDKNNPPKSAAEIDRKFIIIPNSSKPNHYPFEKLESRELRYPENKVPVHTNQRVQLLYVDKDGKASKNFPPNVEIGFFLIANGFRAGSWKGDNMTVDGFTYTTRKNGLINTGTTTYYSNYKFNASQQKRYVACRLADGTVVYGMEDGSDWSLDDMMFTVTASPNKAIHTIEGIELPEIPEQKIPRTYTDKSENYSYAFEDIWPDGGDYDLNDVIIRHSRKITKDQFNDVSKVVDQLTFDISETTGAIDAFALQVPTSHKGDRYTLPTGAWYEEETGSFFLARDVHDVNGMTLELVREFDHPVSFEEIQNELNPFIVNQSKGVDCKSKGRIEIHLPMGEVTALGKHIDNKQNPAQAWYISDDGSYPYALQISDINFTPCDPGVRIGSKNGAYPDFNKWVESKGKEKKDWYKNK